MGMFLIIGFLGALALDGWHNNVRSIAYNLFLIARFPFWLVYRILRWLPHQIIREWKEPR